MSLSADLRGRRVLQSDHVDVGRSGWVRLLQLFPQLACKRLPNAWRGGLQVSGDGSLLLLLIMVTRHKVLSELSLILISICISACLTARSSCCKICRHQRKKMESWWMETHDTQQKNFLMVVMLQPVSKQTLKATALHHIPFDCVQAQSSISLHVIHVWLCMWQIGFE